MDDLKKYKKVWQEHEHEDKRLDADTITKMIHSRSSSIVKWIFYISIIEIVVLTLLNIFAKTDWDKWKDLGLYNFFIGISFITYIIPLLFIYLFYKNYKSISVTNNIKELIKSILKTRQTVKYYIFTVLAIIAFGVLYPFSVVIKDPEYVDIIAKFGENGQLIVWGIVLLITIVALGVILLVYLLLYGILLKRLNANYKELIS